MTGRILVLDDEENYAEMLRDLLLENNYRVDMATRPERAINQLEEIPYDLVISDYKMPVMDGADFLKRSRELYPNLPFILVSGLMNTPELVKVANMSVTLVMEKPLDTAAFLEHVARFSTPMTEEEKAEFQSTSAEAGGAADAVTSYPDEPRYFSASCANSKRFLLDLWALCKTGRCALVRQPPGGDAELAVRDISGWLDNSDKPVSEMTWQEIKNDLANRLAALKTSEDNSNVGIVRLANPDELDQAVAALESIDGVLGENEGYLIFLLESPEAEGDFSARAAGRGVVLPPLHLRSTDTAQYARRFARISASQRGKDAAAEFTPEAAYAVLAHDWPRNYRQLQDAVSAAVEQSEDEPLTVEALGLDPDSVAPEKDRLARILKKAQSAYLHQLLEQSGGNAAALAKELDASTVVYSEKELANLPLIKPEFGQI